MHPPTHTHTLLKIRQWDLRQFAGTLLVWDFFWGPAPQSKLSTGRISESSLEWLTLFPGVSESTYSPLILPVLSSQAPMSWLPGHRKNSCRVILLEPGEEGTSVSQLRLASPPFPGVTWSWHWPSTKTSSPASTQSFSKTIHVLRSVWRQRVHLQFQHASFHQAKEAAPQDADMIMNMRILEELEQQKRKRKKNKDIAMITCLGKMHFLSHLKCR